MPKAISHPMPFNIRTVASSFLRPDKVPGQAGIPNATTGLRRQEDRTRFFVSVNEMLVRDPADIGTNLEERSLSIEDGWTL